MHNGLIIPIIPWVSFWAINLVNFFKVRLNIYDEQQWHDVSEYQKQQIETDNEVIMHLADLLLQIYEV